MPLARDEAGHVWEVDAQGNPVRLVQSASQQPQMPADPTFDYKGPQAAAQAQNTGATAQVNSATIPAQIAKAQADATAAQRGSQTAGLGEGMMWGPDGRTAVAIPGYTRQGLSPEVRQKALAQWESAQTLDNTINELEKLYKEGPGATHGAMAIEDYLPTTANERFNTAANAARGIVRNALGLTGGEANTAAEAQMNLGAYIPQASNRDKTIEDSLGRLRRLRELARSQATATLGGIPDANGIVTPQPNAMTANRLVDTPAQQAAPFGATTGAEAIPPEMANEHAMLLAQLMHGTGKLDPAAYAAARAQLDQKYGFKPNTGEYQKWAVGVNAALAHGGAAVPTGIQPPERPLSSIEQLRNNAVNNPAGAAAAGALDMGSFGGVSALAGDQLNALGNEHPLAMGLGQIAGAIGGTSALGRLGAETLGRAVPKLLGGGKLAQFGRNVATDVGYGGLYGGVSGEGAGNDAALAGIGSVAGQGAGKALGRVVGGFDTTAAAQALRARGIPMTIPQQLGGFARTIEDKATSIPLVGDMIVNRRMDGLRAFNREAMGEAGKPIAFAPSEIGKGGVDQMVNAVGNAYDSATAGANVPFDGQFVADMARFAPVANGLPRDFRVKAGKALENRVAPLTDQGYMTGEQYQQAVRGLKGYKAETSKPGFEQDYRDALTLAQDALTGQMRRGGGAHVVEGLNSADQAYRSIKTVKNAAYNADGTGYVFTPSQLQDAAKATQKKFPGRMAIGDLADTGQEVLPSRVPDSGTAGRAAQMLTGGGLLGLGTGAGALLDGGDGAKEGFVDSAALTALLLLGGTKAGQKALDLATISRPNLLRRGGRAIRKKAGLFGAASIPFALEAGN